MFPNARRTFTVAQIGRLNTAQAHNAITLANNCQSAIHFDGLHTPTFRLEKYRMPNAAFDLDAAALALLQRYSLKIPAILLTEEPYGDSGKADDPSELYFIGDVSEGSVSIVSTHLWSSLAGSRPLQSYVLFAFASIFLTSCADLDLHYEHRGCVLDYCDDPEQIDRGLREAQLCEECRHRLTTAIRNAKVSLAEAAATIRLLNRARGVRQAFIAMPFAKTFEAVYRRAIRPALERSGWHVNRVDRSSWPRIITDAILLGILSSDMVVGEITSGNTNVYYEIGLADAVHADVILLARKGTRLPFDVHARRAIFYSPKRLDKLRSELATMAGPGTSSVAV